MSVNVPDMIQRPHSQEDLLYKSASGFQPSVFLKFRYSTKLLNLALKLVLLKYEVISPRISTIKLYSAIVHPVSLNIYRM